MVTLRDSESVYPEKVLVLGAKGSIGEEVVKLLISKGVKVYAHSRGSVEIYNSETKKFRTESEGADFSNPKEIKELVDFSLKEEIESVVCCIGTYPYAVELDQFQERYEQAISLSVDNAIGPLAFFDLLCDSLAKRRKPLHGIILSSVTTKHLGGHSTMFYTVSKGALEIGIKALHNSH